VLIVNLFHIKSCNGLYHYARDYFSGEDERIQKVLVRKQLGEKASTDFTGTRVEECGWPFFIGHILIAILKRRTIYTPTPHPIPLVSNQIIVFHDPYPFINSFLGKLKNLLLFCSLHTSTCKVMHINKTTSRQFLLRLKLHESRLLYAPNKFPKKKQNFKLKKIEYEKLVIGLIGTDSQKKSYEVLFNNKTIFLKRERFQFRVFGTKTSYFNSLANTFEAFDLVLVDSDQNSLGRFLSSVDVVISLSEYEGFGRPIAAALCQNIPCFLIDTPVSREYFYPGASLFSDPATLVSKISCFPDLELPRVSYDPPLDASRAYYSAKRLILDKVQ
jgi:hypothetical protein